MLLKCVLAKYLYYILSACLLISVVYLFILPFFKLHFVKFKMVSGDYKCNCFDESTHQFYFITGILMCN